MKRPIASAILALPLAITALTAQANAATPGHWENGPHGRVWVAQQYNHRVWVPAHWENTRRGRVWVQGHYENR